MCAVRRAGNTSGRLVFGRFSSALWWGPCPAENPSLHLSAVGGTRGGAAERRVSGVTSPPRRPVTGGAPATRKRAGRSGRPGAPGRPGCPGRPRGPALPAVQPFRRHGRSGGVGAPAMPGGRGAPLSGRPWWPGHPRGPSRSGSDGGSGVRCGPADQVSAGSARSCAVRATSAAPVAKPSRWLGRCRGRGRRGGAGGSEGRAARTACAARAARRVSRGRRPPRARPARRACARRSRCRPSACSRTARPR